MPIVYKIHAHSALADAWTKAALGFVVPVGLCGTGDRGRGTPLTTSHLEAVTCERCKALITIGLLAAVVYWSNLILSRYGFSSYCDACDMGVTRRGKHHGWDCSKRKKRI